MACNILNILGLLTINVARDIEVEIILLDLGDRDHARVCRHLKLRGEDINNLVNILGAQPILGAILDKARTGINHKDTRAREGVLLINNDDTGGDAGAVEQVGGQANDTLDITLADQGAADVALGVAAKQDAVRQNTRAFAGTLERTHNMQEVGVIALLIGRHTKGREAIIRVVKRIEARTPAFV